MINAKIMIKSGTTEELEKTEYLPLKGEVVIYDDRLVEDSPIPKIKFKIGNGETKLKDLEFVQQEQVYLENELLKVNNKKIGIQHDQIILPNNNNWDGKLSVIEDKNYTLLAKNWQENEALKMWYYIVYDNSIRVEDNPIMDIILDASEKEKVFEILENYKLIMKSDTSNGFITFYCYEKQPEIDLKIKIKINH